MALIDSYQVLFDKGVIDKERLFDEALNMLIQCPEEIIDAEWNEIVKRFQLKEPHYTRSMGRQGSGSEILKAFYKEYFSIDITIDPTNNYEPKKNIQKWTKHKINVTIANFQICHIFGKTKNPLTFIAPWNIAYIPKIVDPFTGHEAKGQYVVDFTARLKSLVYKKNAKQIEHYNSILDSIWEIEKVKKAIDTICDRMKSNTKTKEIFEKQIMDEFEKIHVG